jgi:hypothetical protein
VRITPDLAATLKCGAGLVDAIQARTRAPHPKSWEMSPARREKAYDALSARQIEERVDQRGMAASLGGLSALVK